MKATPVILPVILLGVLSAANIVSAQTYQPSNRVPIADNTLGTQVTGSNNNLTITGGVNRGQNLFHSFQDFSVPTGGAATFINPVGNQAIITRVTGNLGSDINGIVNTNGANFFLINPNGIVVGSNAQLNVGRVFAASTANGIDLVDASGRAITFGANPGSDAPLLSVNPNVLLNISQFNLAGGTGEIRNFGTIQTSNSNQYIGLIGGDIKIDGGQINAPGGRVELGGLVAPGQVEFRTAGTNPRLNFPPNVTRSNVSLTNQSTVNVAGIGNGEIGINARNIDLSGNSLIRGGIEQGVGTPETLAGNVRLNATGAIAIDSNSAVVNNVRVNSQGRGGDIVIDADTLSVRDNDSAIQAATYGRGDTGNIRITIAGNIDLSGTNAGINTLVSNGAVGNAGNVAIETGSLSLQNGAVLAAVTGGQGNAGNITVRATQGVSLTDADITSNMEGVGKGGNIFITTDALSLQAGATIQALTFGLGDAGNVTVTATNAVSLTGKRTAILNTVEAGSIGKGGEININAGTLSLTNGSFLTAANNGGTGNAGNTNLNVNGAIDITGQKGQPVGGISSVVTSNAIGDGGSITINARSFSLQDSTSLLAGNLGQGNAGTIKISATDAVSLTSTGGLFVTTASKQGIGGDVAIVAPRISLDNGFRINADSVSGNGGNVRIGNRPNANLPTTNLLTLRRGATIATNASGTPQQGGNGGNININAQFIVAVPTENNDITANAVKGRGGNVSINAQGLFGIQLRPRQTSNSDITASSDLGQSGNVAINTPGIDPAKDLSELPTVPTDPTKQISQTCSTDRVDNKFYVTGQGGHPPNAEDLLTNDVLWLDARVVTAPAIVARTEPIQQLPQSTVGWVFDGQGKVTLMASAEGAAATTKVTCPNR
jgi:filamentous hemagglutinin family protein